MTKSSGCGKYSGDYLFDHPSAKYSVSGVAAHVVRRHTHTAIDGLSGRGNAVAPRADAEAAAPALSNPVDRTDRAMFLSCCSPMSRRRDRDGPRHPPCTRAETQIRTGLG